MNAVHALMINCFEDEIRAEWKKVKKEGLEMSEAWLKDQTGDMKEMREELKKGLKRRRGWIRLSGQG